MQRIVKYSLILTFLLVNFSVKCNDGLLDYTESNWGGACSTGKRQTPINIPSKSQTKDGSSYFEILMTNYTMIQNTSFTYQAGYKYRADLPNQGYIWVKKNGYTYAYQLYDMHIHIVSEHAINNNYYDMELHFVHKRVAGSFEMYNPTANVVDPDAANTLLVVGVLWKASATSDNSNIKLMNFDTLSTISNLKVTDFVSNTKSFYHYIGGLTTPTCDEIVNWVVLENVETMSAAQYKVIKSWIAAEYPNGNARAVKPLNGRTVYYIPQTDAAALVNIATTTSGSDRFKNNFWSMIVLISSLLIMI